MPKTLTAVDWEDAALEALERGGAPAVSVEAIARQLGSTKGSFYWHFENREALLAAALERWEKQYTGRVIEGLEAKATARERLSWLIRAGNASESSWRIHVALGASTDPLVVRALARVSKRRVAYLEACYRELGSKKERARQQALLAYASYLGFLRLRVEGPAELPDARGRDAFLESMVEMLVPA